VESLQKKKKTLTDNIRSGRKAVEFHKAIQAEARSAKKKGIERRPCGIGGGKRSSDYPARRFNYLAKLTKAFVARRYIAYC